jgi:hypothetical protein
MENIKIIPKHTAGNTFLCTTMKDVLGRYFTVTKEVLSSHLYAKSYKMFNLLTN